MGGRGERGDRRNEGRGSSLLLRGGDGRESGYTNLHKARDFLGAALLALLVFSPGKSLFQIYCFDFTQAGMGAPRQLLCSYISTWVGGGGKGDQRVGNTYHSLSCKKLPSIQASRKRLPPVAQGQDANFRIAMWLLPGGTERADGWTVVKKPFSSGTENLAGCWKRRIGGPLEKQASPMFVLPSLSFWLRTLPGISPSRWPRVWGSSLIFIWENTG